MIVSFFIGSGFSVPAGYPTGRDMNDRISHADEYPFGFYTDGSLVLGKDGEKPDLGFNNMYDEAFDFCMKLIRYYSATHNFDYEEFYDYLIDAWRGVPYGNVDEYLYELLPNNIAYDNREVWLHIELDRCRHVLQEIVSYFLLPPPTIPVDAYLRWIQFIRTILQTGSVVNIYSLNHDTLVESLFRENHLEEYVSDGFDFAGSVYYGVVQGKETQLPYFNNIYNNQLSLHKLHGSVDYYIFNQESEPTHYSPVAYVKRLWGLEDYGLFRKSEKQRITKGLFGYDSEVLTGPETKISKYEEPLYFKKQFDNFKNDLTDTNCVFVIGYGFKDRKINEILKDYLRDGAKCYVIDPYIGDDAVAKAEEILRSPIFISQSIDKVDWTLIE